MSKYRLFETRERQEAETAIDALIAGFAGTYEVIKAKYPHIGLGDTATDERVAGRLYGVVHFNDWFWPEKVDDSYTNVRGLPTPELVDAPNAQQ